MIGLFALKIAWAVVIAALVSAIHFRVTRAAYLDARWVKASSRIQAKKITAQAFFRQEVVVFFFQSALLLIRFWTIFWPMPISESFAWRWAADATIITALQCVLAYSSYLNDKDRQRAIQLLEEDERLYRKGKEIEDPGSTVPE